MNRTKHIIKLLVFGVLAGILLLIGAGKDLSLGKGLSLTWAGLGRILLVIFAVLAVEQWSTPEFGSSCSGPAPAGTVQTSFAAAALP